MPLFARSDLASISVSADHGGCGKVHTRPAPGGNPVHPWKLECSGGCEDFLRHDPLWSSTISEIPETHDEQIRREDLEKRGARNQQQMTALALAKLAGIPGAADALGMAMGSDGSAVTACPAGHPNPAGAKFCTECGSKITTPGPALCPDGHESPDGSRFCVECGRPTGVPVPDPRPVDGPPAPPEPAGDTPAEGKLVPEPPAGAVTAADDGPDLASLHPATLKKMCRAAGLKDTGTKAELIKRLQKAPKAAV